MKKQKDVNTNSQLLKWIEFLKNNSGKTDLKLSGSEIQDILELLKKCHIEMYPEPQYENNKFCQEIINHMNDIVWVVDFDGKFIDVNKKATELLGFTKEELLSMGPKDIDTKLSEEQINELIKKMPDLGIQVLETEHLTKDGKRIPVELSSSLIPFNGEQVILSIARNISERKRTENELLISNEKYYRIFESTGTATLIVNEDTTIALANKECGAVTGYKAEELIGKKWTQFVAPESLEEMVKFHYLRRKNPKLAPKKYEVKLIRKDDKIRDVIIDISMMPDISQSIVVMYDITKQKRNERILRESEMKLDEAMKIADIGTWELDVEKDFFIFNDQFYKLLHTTAKREGGYIMSLKKYADKFLHPDDMPLVEIETKKALETNDPNYFSKLDHRIIYADGKTGYFNVNIRIKKDVNGKTIKTYGVNQDITNRKKTEEELRNFKEHLEDLVKERTREIEEQNKELERYIKLFEGREFRIHELKEKIKVLEKQLREN